MDLKKALETLDKVRTEVRAFIDEAEKETPHLVNAAGAISTAIRNLQGHEEAAAAAAKPAPET